jgi:hypothetical protein
MLEVRQSREIGGMDDTDGIDEPADGARDPGQRSPEGDGVDSGAAGDEVDAVMRRIDSWEELLALPWELQQECERRYPELVRRLELGYIKEMRFPTLD